MGIKINIPEAKTIRRLAAGLASALSVRSNVGSSLNMNLSTRVYFRHFPWTGIVRTAADLPDYQNASVGQYFAGFNWDGNPADPITAEGNAPDTRKNRPPNVEHYEPMRTGHRSSAEILLSEFLDS